MKVRQCGNGSSSVAIGTARATMILNTGGDIKTARATMLANAEKKGIVEKQRDQMAAAFDKRAKEAAPTIERGFYIRDTLVDRDRFNSLPANQRRELLDLKDEYEKSGYIDARTQIGPDQNRRISDRQRKKLGDRAIQVFKMEDRARVLLRTPQEQNAIAQRAKRAAIEKELDAVQRTIRTHEQYNHRSLNSKRNNSTKRDYQERLQQKKDLERQLKDLEAPAS